MMNASPIKIGTIEIGEGRTHRQTFETASWYRDYAIPAGTYDVVGYVQWRGDDYKPEYRGPWIPDYAMYVRIPAAVCTGSLFVNRLLHCSSSNLDEDVGQVHEVSFSVGAMSDGVTLDPAVVELPTMRFQALRVVRKAAA